MSKFESPWSRAVLASGEAPSQLCSQLCQDPCTNCLLDKLGHMWCLCGTLNWKEPFYVPGTDQSSHMLSSLQGLSMKRGILKDAYLILWLQKFEFPL